MGEDLKPKISILIATYNRGRFLPEAINGILRQSFKEWELIIIDDASDDGTEKIVAPFLKDQRIKYFRNSINQNISYTRNRGLDEAQGKYVAILDSDDVWSDPDKLKKQHSFLETNPDYLALGTQAEAVDDTGRKIKALLVPLSDKNIRKNILLKNPLIHSSVLYRKDPVIASGKYDLKLNAIEDYDLWLRLGTMGKLANLPESSIYYRLHGGNQSSIDRLRLMKENINLIKKNRRNYPYFYQAYFRRLLRYSLYWLFRLLN